MTFRSLLVLAIMVPGILVGFVDRFVALIVYLWFALFRPQEWLWMDVSNLRLSLILGLILVVPSLLTGVLPDLTHPLSVGTLLFLATSLVAQIGAVDSAVGWDWIDFLARLSLVCLFTVTLLSTRKRFIITLAVISGSLGFHTAKTGLASLLWGDVRFQGGLAGSFSDNNGYALAAVMILFLLVATGQNLKPFWMRAGFFVAAPLTAVMVVSTFSRGGFLALIASALVFALLQRHRLAVSVLLVAGVVLFLVFVGLPDGYIDRVKTIQTYEEVREESALGRLHFWRVAVDMALDRPLGVGLRNYEAAYDTYDFSHGEYGHARSVHSSFFQALAETGFLGAAIFVGLFLYAFLIAFRVRSRSKRNDLSAEDAEFFFTTSNALIASMAGFVVGGAFVALALNDLTWLTFALVASLHRLSAAPCLAESLDREPVLLLEPAFGQTGSLSVGAHARG